MAFFDKLKSGLLKTRENLSKQIDSVLKFFKKVDDELFDELFDALILADIGVKASQDIIESLKKRVREKHISEADEVKALLKEIIAEILGSENAKLNLDTKPSVILVIGVNGVGKTTSIAKLAYILKNEGKKVILAAADTFRAAAIDQLEIWANRVGVEIIKQSEGADPAAVIYDGIKAAKSRGADVLICDTAGRLHNKKNLMSELEKINRVISRELDEGSKEVLLVLDATTGQNAVSQAREFKSVTDITGVILTKLDGTAKGGIVIAVKSELGIPVKLVGVGEGLEDMQIFDAAQFASALLD